MAWKYFRQFELREALAHVDAGGIAVHESGRTRGGKPTAHLLAATPRDLANAAEAVGLDAKYVQANPRQHFDIWGQCLEKAILRCMEDQA